MGCFATWVGAGACLGMCFLPTAASGEHFCGGSPSPSGLQRQHRRNTSGMMSSYTVRAVDLTKKHFFFFFLFASHAVRKIASVGRCAFTSCFLFFWDHRPTHPLTHTQNKKKMSTVLLRSPGLVRPTLYRDFFRVSSGLRDPPLNYHLATAIIGFYVSVALSRVS